MYYVYILQSEIKQDQFYVGRTSDLKRRYTEHNSGRSPHTSLHRPWKLINYFAFLTKEKASKFEEYLKTQAGRRFQMAHFGA